MRGLAGLSVALILVFVFSCSDDHGARSEKSFDEIAKLIEDKTAREVEDLLGRPDGRYETSRDERWVWWNYTYLDGESYAPEIRERIVHLEIILQPPSMYNKGPHSEWRVAALPYGVSYSLGRVNR